MSKEGYDKAVKDAFFNMVCAMVRFVVVADRIEDNKEAIMDVFEAVLERFSVILAVESHSWNEKSMYVI